MKDLYRRNKLAPLESDRVKIHACRADTASDQEAAFTVLLNKEKKAEYDRAYRAAKMIGLLRSRLRVKDETDWRVECSDFVNVIADTIPVNPERPKAPLEIPAILRDGARSYVYLSVAGILIIALAFGMFGGESQDENQTLSEQGVQEKHVSDATVSVRAAAHEDAPILGELNRYQDVIVSAPHSAGEWEGIQLDGGIGYVPDVALGSGPGERALISDCRSQGASRRPANGEYLGFTQLGRHKLILINPPGDDAIVKLKDAMRAPVLFIYVHGGSTVTIEDVPEGVYHVEHAIGKNFSKQCGIFLDEVTTYRDPSAKKFISEVEGLETYPTTITYTLKSGSFDLERIRLNQF